MSALGTNQSYLTTICKGPSSSPDATAGSSMVTANAMAKVNMEIQNHWVNILEALGLQGDGSSDGLTSLARSAFSAAQIFSGYSFLPSIFTSHVWRGSSGLQLSIQLRFDAWNDAAKDVLEPCQKLLQMFLPVRGGAGAGSGFSTLLSSLEEKTGLKGLDNAAGSLFLHPPGPTPYEYVQGGNAAAQHMFHVNLGTVLIITELIPTTIAWEFEERFDKGGNPVAAMMTVGFITYVVPDAAVALGWFQNKRVDSFAPISPSVPMQSQ